MERSILVFVLIVGQNLTPLESHCPEHNYHVIIWNYELLKATICLFPSKFVVVSEFLGTHRCAKKTSRQYVCEGLKKRFSSV